MTEPETRSVAKTRRHHKIPVHVSITHGNLAFARYPVAVGHYAGDAIVSAEKYLDRTLGGALTRLSQLQLYPGPIETTTFVANPKLRDDPDAKPQGAIVVGLGTPTNLSAVSLTRSCTHALMEYVSAWTQGRQLLGRTSARQLNEIGLTTLLIGTGAGGVSLPDSLYALLRAVAAANRSLEAAGRSERICDIEIIELWEDIAIQAARCLIRLQQAPEMKGLFSFDRMLKSRKGGQRRVCFEEAPNWWQRLQILGGGEGDVDRGILRFMATTRRARSEVRLLPTQKLLVDRFIEKAIRTTSNDQAISRTLFELLLPNELKEQAPNQDDTVFLLDEYSARYPWEILEDPKCTDGPSAVQSGLLRQLASPIFREGAKNALANTALVIGDPESSFVELPGAQREARTVARVLEKDGRFSVTSLIHPDDSRTVINALFDRPYRVVHLAGHGVYQYVPPHSGKCRICEKPLEGLVCPEHGDTVLRQTGMVLGDGIFLTPTEVHQMREVPALVFINCCHLGRIEPESTREGNEQRDFHVIAANLSTEFIRMGVRAIVAAGWAVDDAAADTFAKSFYTQMLSGECFGDAVKYARKDVFDRHPRVNTWGAYQCYGDPDYRLLHSQNPKRVKEEILFVSVEEAIDEINNIASGLSTKAEGETEWEPRRLNEIVGVLKKNNWLIFGRVNAALAHAYGEACYYREAIRYFRRALAMEDTGLTLKDIEQYVNYLGRNAVRMWKQRNTAKTGSAIQWKGSPEEEIRRALDLIDWLDAFGTSAAREGNRADITKHAAAQRRSFESALLRAGVLQNLAWIRPRPNAALNEMADAYRNAQRCAGKGSPAFVYAMIETLFADTLRYWIVKSGGRNADKARREEIKERIRRVDRIAKAQTPAEDSLSFLGPVKLHLLKALHSEKLGIDELHKLSEHFNGIRKRIGPREFASILDHLEFLETMAAAAKKKEMANQLRELRRSVSSG